VHPSYNEYVIYFEVLMYAVISEISLAQDLQTIVSFYVEEYLEVADNLT